MPYSILTDAAVSMSIDLMLGALIVVDLFVIFLIQCGYEIRIGGWRD